jgi:hypothetical protein
LHYDFIEVGTSDFDTLCEISSDEIYGISIEAVGEYVDVLPNKKNVKKVHAAMVPNELLKTENNVKIYYVKSEVIEKEKLRLFLKGCNKIGSPHDFHYFYTDDFQTHLNNQTKANKKKLIPVYGRNLLKEGLVTCEDVKCISWKVLFDTYDVTSVDYVKIDAEGADSELIVDLMKECNKRGGVYPKFIRFETGSSGNQTHNLEALELLKNNNYHVINNHIGFNYDTIAFLINN